MVGLFPALQFALFGATVGHQLQDGMYAVMNVHSGLFLDVDGGSTQSAANVLIGHAASTSHGHWHLRVHDDATYTIQNAHSGMYLSTPAVEVVGNGANVFVWSSALQPESLWRLHLVQGTAFSVENVKVGRFLSVAGASIVAGANVHLWNSSEFVESQWQFISKGVCIDAVAGDWCYNHTIWAKDYGINARPEWYPGLTNTSSFSNFQAHMHYCYWGRCPMPCASTDLYSCQIPGRFWSDAECQDAVQGTKCHDEVTWAMDYGINDHPEWYPSLTNQSSFGEFQARLFQGEKAAIESNECPEPCCHDTLPGELCHEDAEWAMLYGINVPEVSHWYPPSLTNQSSLAEFQAWMHLCHADRCPEPCIATEILASPFDASLDCA